jgi:hypothetical protein
MGALMGPVVGCAALSSDPDPLLNGNSGDEGMSPARMELIFGSLVPAIEGPSGAIRTVIDGINIYLISDPANDQMRMLVPIADVQGLDPQIFNALLEANFSNTPDARYGISEGTIFATFMHPISSLTPELIESALSQVIGLHRTYVGLFSRGRPSFR